LPDLAKSYLPGLAGRLLFSTLSHYNDLFLQRGTHELKKYLRSRLEEPVVTTPIKPQGLRQTKVASGIFGADGDGIDAFTINQTKALDYRYAESNSFKLHPYYFFINAYKLKLFVYFKSVKNYLGNNSTIYLHADMEVFQNSLFGSTNIDVQS
jgi:hypothetical protein